MPKAPPRKPKGPPPRRAYVPRGAAFDLCHSHAPEVLISGPAGTGKSVACLVKLHTLACHVPGLRALLCRRTRKSLTDTGLVTFERDVLPPAARGKVQRAGRHSYPYPNGSEIVVGGLDNPASIMSSDYDLIYIQEATEAEEGAVELLTTRLYRSNRLPYQQLLMDCNPDRPTHWLRQRCLSGRTVMLESRHEDNPVLYDEAAGDWTAEGVRYLSVLDALTGPRKARLRYGRWTGAEGLVFDEWDRAVHVIDPFPVPTDWPRFRAIDFGYVNAFCCLFAAMDRDGRLYVYRQIYRTKRLVSEHAKRITGVSAGEPPPYATVADTEDREGRETLAAAGIPTVGCRKGKGVIEAGLQAVRARLKPAGDGRPRLFVMRDSLDERDEELASRKQPCALEEEMDGYALDPRAGRDQPAANQADHGISALRYLAYALDAPREEEEDDGGVTVYRA